MSQKSLHQAVEAIRSDGYVILEHVVSLEHLKLLREKMEADLHTLIQKTDCNNARRTRRRFSQSPPPFAPFVFSDIVANPFVVQVSRSVLGKGMYCNLYSSNTNCPDSEPQPVHVDAGQLWPNVKHAHPEATLAIDIALGDVDEQNGSIELWPGTHLDTSATLWVSQQRVEERNEIAPPVRGNTKKGSALIRDARLWHRGTSNRSAETRFVVTMNHHIYWLERGQPLKFNKGCEASFRSSDLSWHIEFTDNPIDYLRGAVPVSNP